MAQFRFIPIPTEVYDDLGITSKTLLQTHVTDDGALIITKVTEDDLEEFICDGDCVSCPVAGTYCNGGCLSCPCYACCGDSGYDTNCKRE